jgi:hypothetical protein
MARVLYYYPAGRIKIHTNLAAFDLIPRALDEHNHTSKQNTHTCFISSLCKKKVAKSVV